MYPLFSSVTFPTRFISEISNNSVCHLMRLPLSLIDRTVGPILDSSSRRCIRILQLFTLHVSECDSVCIRGSGCVKECDLF